MEIFPNTTIDEEIFLYLNKLNETRHDAALANEAHKQRMKVQCNMNVQTCSYNEGDLVLTYDQKHDKLGAGKFESMWHGPYIVRRFLEKGAYVLVDYDGIPLGEPRNGLYLKTC